MRKKNKLLQSELSKIHNFCNESNKNHIKLCSSFYAVTSVIVAWTGGRSIAIETLWIGRFRYFLPGVDSLLFVADR